MHSLPRLDLKHLQPAENTDLCIPTVLGYTAQSWCEALRSSGPIVQLNIDNQPCVAISSTAANQLAWRNPDNWSYQDTDFSTIFRTQLGPDHVTILDGEPHRRLRKLILPGFGAAALRRDMRTLYSSFVQDLESHAGQSADLYALACLVMAKALNQTQIKTAISSSVLTSLCSFEEEFIAGLQLRPAQQSQWFARPAYQQVRGVAFEFFNQILKERSDGARRNDSLDIILSRSETSDVRPLRKTEIIESIYLLSVAGVGNIAHFLCTMMWKVAGTDWQTAVQKELSGVDLANIDGMKQLPILKALINETERLYAPAPVIPKRTTQAIEFLGHQIPAGTLILHLHTLSHYNSEVYESPFEFQPQRWLDDTPPKTNAFGGGKHLCLGMGVTRALLPLLAGLLLRKYTMELPAAPHGKPLDPDFGAAPVSTVMPVTLHPLTD
jgi:hypothetical protein